MEHSTMVVLPNYGLGDPGSNPGKDQYIYIYHILYKYDIGCMMQIIQPMIRVTTDCNPMCDWE